MPQAQLAGIDYAFANQVAEAAEGDYLREDGTTAFVRPRLDRGWCLAHEDAARAIVTTSPYRNRAGIVEYLDSVGLIDWRSLEGAA